GESRRASRTMCRDFRSATCVTEQELMMKASADAGRSNTAQPASCSSRASASDSAWFSLQPNVRIATLRSGDVLGSRLSWSGSAVIPPLSVSVSALPTAAGALRLGHGEERRPHSAAPALRCRRPRRAGDDCARNLPGRLRRALLETDAGGGLHLHCDYRPARA